MAAAPVALPKSDELFARAMRSLPGGNTRTTVFVAPHPPYARSGEGWRIVDEDGSELIDALGNYTALIHGHAHPRIVDAAHAAIAEGASFGLPTRHEVAFAEHLAERVAMGEQWRFTNSGTEAVMMALRLARAVTGRDRVLRFEGCYHGTCDAVVSGASPGIPQSVAADVIVVPLEDLDATSAALDNHGDDLACVLLDSLPNRAGLRPADPDFVQTLRAETARRGVLLVHDEILSFRVAYAGFHADYDVEPDIVTLGKIIGGGFPIGAVGGRAHVMEHFDPRRLASVGHGGTFSANPVSMRAGLAALELFDAPEVERLNALGERLRAELGVAGWTVTGHGSLLRVHVADPRRLWWDLYGAGLLTSVNGLLCLSTPMDERVIDRILQIYEAVEERYL